MAMISAWWTTRAMSAGARGKPLAANRAEEHVEDGDERAIDSASTESKIGTWQSRPDFDLQPHVANARP
jgi:hypothetical protein